MKPTPYSESIPALRGRTRRGGHLFAMLALTMLFVAAALAAPGDGFALAWSVIDGASDRSAGDGFVLVGHVPDAAPSEATTEAPMTSGALALLGALTPHPDGQIITCPGDVDESGHVDGNDVVAVLGHLGSCLDAGPCPGDVDRDRIVGPGDLLIVIHSFGACP